MEGSNTSLKSYRFPRGVDLGASYGSYLTSPRTLHKPSSVPVLPKIQQSAMVLKEGTPTMTSLYNSLQVLVESLNVICTQTKARGCTLHSLYTTYVSLSTALYDLGPVLQQLDRSHDSHTTEETLHVMMVYVMMAVQSLVESVDVVLTSKSSDSKERSHEHTKAELFAVKNNTNKLSQKLQIVEETNKALQQELDSTKHLLKVTAKELETEKHKLQSAKLTAQQNKRELVDAKRLQPNAVQKLLEKEINCLQHKLEQKHKVERQLTRQTHEDGIKIKHLQSVTNAKRKKEIEQAYTIKNKPSVHQRYAAMSLCYIRSLFRRHPFPTITRPPYSHNNLPHLNHEQLAEPPIKKPHPPQYSMTEIASLAKFTDRAVAVETMNLLDKQGFLH